MQQCPLEPLRGWRRGNTITALRSLFRFATRLRIVFTNPTARLANPLRRRDFGRADALVTGWGSVTGTASATRTACALALAIATGASRRRG